MLPEASSLWLLRLLRDIQLAQFYRPILEELNVTRPEHFDFVKPEDLDGIGMGRPAQRRLAEALKRHRSGLKSKNWVYKILGGFVPEQKETTPPSDSPLLSLPEPEGGLKCLIPDGAVCRGELLGSGCFGVVHRGLWTLPSGQSVPVAVKSLRVGPEGPVGTELGDFLREVSIMMNLEHPHVLRLHGLVLGQPLQMVMELAPLGSLHARLAAPAPTPPLPVALLCLFLRQLAGAMAYLGARGLVHRDLATRNLLLASPRTIKVADFGLVRPLRGARGRYVMGGPRPIPYAWCAPESLRHGAFSSASDVWMFGVTLWEMFSGGEEPWAGVPPYLILQRLEKDRARLPRPPLCPRALYALALRCWAPHPADRPSFPHLEGLLQEAWPPEAHCVREVTEPGALRMETGDPITVIEASPDSTTWKGQNGRTFKVGSFPASAVTLADSGGSPATRPVHRVSPARGELHQGSTDGDRGKAKLRDLPPARGQRRNVPLQRARVISKSLESVLSLGPRPTGGGSSPPELRHARAVTRGPPGLPSCPPFASSPSQPSQPPRERPPWPRREPLPSHPPGKPGAGKATVPSGGLLPDPELQRRIMEVELSVHGVTHQECQAALRATGGDVVSAIRNLKVDQLFHLSSRSRADCRRILEHYQWDLSAASRYVLARP
ncbi:non-receptor tyrosine-protein kinase TNK1 [Prionailurus viverrinus]|uniref:non-receptor tyrosine-protein kinase TNK1 n=1 Tax=Prionailurus viverrinus TaxID=61388 RepID=UPI001FF2A983|nr:non-receptor tyrosine-protein kinase TNK1 [Prionailurus viverrinus]XP_047688547.1 non-receptor tyrosine-protein kinase TNK1 [Prionailurus viverrinus]XP_047688548.1 non-receptor tyrosine-protein kinase TNK1 [Prionailurus viverrinus]XP_047688549.1 non-receptor tyrosine-protein kinase TNK1 [Prionailurus viverrinus]XP_047688550.1 non-receptor tyrosine-protein kinase TNK1 [Prionailurus viverrinus]